ncbi:MAG: RNA polymerase sporulation sigma factor SigH [Lachnospiraceae bacterium]|nr:RNA polymerase sporulation sigma factor SigH [Lachnospiraceae bacterium]
MKKEQFAKKTDEELIRILHEGDTGVIDFLMEKYKNLVRKYAKVMFIQGADNDDLIQEGMIGLFKAIRDYDENHEASFQTFARLCISRQILTAIENSRRKKHAPLNSYVSLYANDEDGEETLIGSLATLAQSSPEEIVLDRERVELLMEKIMGALSPFEGQVFRLYLVGMDYTEIARTLGKEEKSTDNALQRIKRKIRDCLKNDN